MTDTASVQAQADAYTAELARRTQAIADGQIVSDGKGNWTNTDLCEVVGKDGLAQTAAGEHMAAFARRPAWHGFGTVFDTDTAMTAQQALKAAHLDWTVSKRPLFSGQTDEAKMGTDRVPNQWAIWRDANPDDNIEQMYLGVVGRRHTVIQNHDGFDFLDRLTGQDGQMGVESAGMCENRVFISLFLPDNVVLDPKGMADMIKPYLMSVNPHDGSGSFYVVATPLRGECMNTVRWATKIAPAKWSTPHVGDPLARWKQAQETMGLTIAYYREFTDEATRMIQTPMSNAKFDELIKDLFPLAKDAPKSAVTRVTKHRDQLRYLFRESPTNANIRNTVWGAEQALFEDIDWLSGVRPPKHLTEELARGRRLVADEDEKRKNYLHQRLMMRVK